jgi:hypothetical protein
MPMMPKVDVLVPGGEGRGHWAASSLQGLSSMAMIRSSGYSILSIIHFDDTEDMAALCFDM